MDKDTKHNIDQSKITEGYLGYTKQKEKARLTNLMWATKKNQQQRLRAVLIKLQNTRH